MYVSFQCVLLVCTVDVFCRVDGGNVVGVCRQ